MKILEGVGWFKIGVNIKDTSFSKSAILMSKNSTLSVEVVHVKCMVGWQELSLRRKASRDSHEPDYTQRMSSM